MITDANGNTAGGAGALTSLTTGLVNTAIGAGALNQNSTGSSDAAFGYYALGSSVSGNHVTAIGAWSMQFATGNYNTTIGTQSLQYNATGNNNIAIGDYAAFNLHTGDNNIIIGDSGVDGESNTIRIGGDNGEGYGPQTATFIAGINGVNKSSGKPVFIDSNGQLGTGSVLPTGAIIQLIQGSPAPVGGFTKIGTTSFQYHDLTGHNHVIAMDIYQKS